jgi:hypothetical protein
MPKGATVIVLTKQEQAFLLQITKRHRSEQQVVLHAHIVEASSQGYPSLTKTHNSHRERFGQYDRKCFSILLTTVSVSNRKMVDVLTIFSDYFLTNY